MQDKKDHKTPTTDVVKTSVSPAKTEEIPVVLRAELKTKLPTTSAQHADKTLGIVMKHIGQRVGHLQPQLKETIKRELAEYIATIS